MKLSFRKQTQALLYAMIFFFALSLSGCEGQQIDPDCNGEYDVAKASLCYDQGLEYDSAACRCY